MPPLTKPAIRNLKKIWFSPPILKIWSIPNVYGAKSWKDGGSMDIKSLLKSGFTLTAIASFFFCHVAIALPENGQVAQGAATISQNTNQVVITQTTQNAVINWQNFNTSSTESVLFNQPNSSAIALNRINSGLPTQFAGQLNANGQVWILNPAGVLFTSTSKVDVAGLVATTHNISDANFMMGNYKFDLVPGSENSKIINNGLISVKDSGIVALVAPYVENNGVIVANLGKVNLSTGASYALDLYGDNLINFGSNAPIDNGSVSNAGQIIASGGKVYLTANSAAKVVDNVVSMSGVIEATTATTGKNGEIILNGGSAGVTHVSGKLKAPNGHVETSGHILILHSDIVIDATGGNWLVDPWNITVVAGSGTTNNSGPTSFSPTGTSSQIGANLINAQLGAGTNVTLDTNSGGSDAGNITISSGITWSTSAVFTLIANNNIAINAVINGGANGLVTLNAGGAISQSAGITANTLTTTSGTGTALTSVFNAVSNFSATNTTSGNISFTNTLPLTIVGLSAQSNGSIAISNSGNITFNSAFVVPANTSLTSTSGSIIFNSTVDDVALRAHSLTLTSPNFPTFFSAPGSLTPLGTLNISRPSITVDATLGSFVIGQLNLGTNVGLTSSSSGMTISSPITAASTGAFSATASAGINLGVSMSTGGSQSYIGPVSLTATPLTLTSSVGNIFFSNTLNGATDLILMATGGSVTLGGIVGGSTPLTSLTITAPLNINISTATINTSGDQIYNSPMVINTSSTLTSSVGNIDFRSTIRDNGVATITFAPVTTVGTIKLQNNVQFTGASQINVTGNGGILLGGSSALTIQMQFGRQTYTGPITLNQNVKFSEQNVLGTDITFNGSINAATAGVQTLEVSNFDNNSNTGGVLTFNSPIGSIVPLGNLLISFQGAAVTFNNAVNVNGTVYVNSSYGASGGANSITFANGANLNATGAVTLISNNTLVNTSITINSVITAPSLTATAGNQGITLGLTGQIFTTGATSLSSSSGPVAINGQLGSVGNPLGSLAVTGSSITFGATATSPINTVGAQTYNGPVILNTSEIMNSSAGSIIFGSSITGAFSLIVNAATTATFSGNVGNPVPLSSLNVTAPSGITVGTFGVNSSVTTVGDMIFNNSITPGGLSTITYTTTGGGNISFQSYQRVFNDNLNAIASSPGHIILNGGISMASGSAIYTAPGGIWINTSSSFVPDFAITFNGPVTLMANATLNSGLGGVGVLLNGTVDSCGSGGVACIGGAGPFGLTVNQGTAGNGPGFNLNFAVGSLVPLSYLSIIQPLAAMNINAPITVHGVSATPGADGYILLKANANFGAGLITIASLLDATDSITPANGTVSIDGGLGITFAVGSGVTSSGNQSYNPNQQGGGPGRGPVLLQQNTTLTSTGGSINFTGISGSLNIVSDAPGTPRNLTLHAPIGGVSMGLSVGSPNPINLLTVNGVINFNSQSTAVTTIGSQLYNSGATFTTTPTLTTTTAGGDILFGGPVNGSGGVLLVVPNTDTITFNSTVGVTTALLSVTTSATGTTYINGGQVRTSSGAQNWNNQVYIGADTVLGGVGTTGPININVALDSLNSTPRALTLTTTGMTFLNGNLGATNILSGLTVTNAATLNVSSIHTTTFQNYNGALTLTGNSNLFTNAGGTITFGSTIQGGFNLTANATPTGTVNFNNDIGTVGTPLTGLTVTGLTNIAAAVGPTIFVSGTQTYNNNVLLNSIAALTFGSGIGSTTVFNGTVNRTGVSTAITIAGNLAVGPAGSIGLSSVIASLLVNGTTLGPNVTTSGNQTYVGAVTLNTDETMTSTAGVITFNSTIDGDIPDIRSLTVIGGVLDGEIFKGSIGSTVRLLALTTGGGIANFGDSAAISSITITTAGDQNYNNGIKLLSPASFPTTFTSTAGLFKATFTGGFGNLTNIQGQGSIVVNVPTNKTITLQAPSGPMITNTTGSQTYNGPAITVAGSQQMTSTAGDITFNNTWNINGGVTVTANNVNINGNVNGNTTDFVNGALSLLINGSTHFGPLVTMCNCGLPGGGGPSFNGAVIFDSANLTINGRSLLFGGTVTGTTTNAVLVLNNNDFNGGITFNGNVFIPGASSSLTITDFAGGGFTRFNSPLTTVDVKTQIYNPTAFNISTGAATTLVLKNTASGISNVTIGGGILNSSAGLNILGNLTLATAQTTTLASLNITGNTLLGGTTSFATTAGNINFGGTINNPFALTLNSGANNVILGGAVGSVSPLSSLTVTGATNINATAISTSGNQLFNSSVTLGANSTLTSTTGNITFGSTVNGAFNLIASAALAGKTITFNGVVGSITPLASLASSVVGSTSATIFNTTFVKTTGAQTYTGPVRISNPTNPTNFNFVASTVSFNDAVMVNNTSPTNLLNITIGSTSPSVITNLVLASPNGNLNTTITGLMINSLHVTGTTSFGTPNLGVYTLANQTYDQAVTLNADTVLTTQNLGAITTFNSTVNGAYNLFMNASGGSVTFNGLVGNSVPLASLFVSAGQANVNTTLISTSGIQNYNATPILLSVPATTAITVFTASEVDIGDYITTIPTPADLTINGNLVMNTPSGNISTVGTFVRNIVINGSTTVNSGITTPYITASQNLTFNGSIIVLGPGLSGTQPALFSAGTGILTVNGNIDGPGPLQLLASATGAININGTVGTTTPLSSFQILGFGGTPTTTNINTAAIHTVNNQTYTNLAMVLDQNTVWTSNSGGINFASGTTVNALANGGQSLQLIAANPVVLTGNIGDINKLSILTIGSNSVATPATLATPSISTTQSQTYFGPVTLNSPTVTLNAGITNSIVGTVTFGNTIDATTAGSQGLVINAASVSNDGSITFRNNVGVLQALNSLTLNAYNSNLNPNNISNFEIKTTGDQNYGLLINLQGNIMSPDGIAQGGFVSTNGNIITSSIGNGLNTTSPFGMTVSVPNGTFELNNVRVDSLHVFSGTTYINRGFVTTTHDQTYDGPVKIRGQIALSAPQNINGVTITFNGPIDADTTNSTAHPDISATTVNFGSAANVGSTFPVGELDIFSTVTNFNASSIHTGQYLFIQSGTLNLTQSAVTFANDSFGPAGGFGNFGIYLPHVVGTGTDLTLAGDTYLGLYQSNPVSVLLKSLTVNAGYLTAIEGGLVSTVNDQTYNGQVVIDNNGNNSAVNLNGATITFGDVVAQNPNVTPVDLIITGNMVANAPIGPSNIVGGFFAGQNGTLKSLTINGQSNLNGGLVNTNNNQIYNGPVLLGATNLLNSNSGNVTFESTINNNFDLTVDALQIRFKGDVGGAAALGVLNVSGNVINFDGSLTSVTTLGTQTYTGTGSNPKLTVGVDPAFTAPSFVFAIPVIIAADTTYTSTVGDIDFQSTVDGPANLTINPAGTAIFEGDVGATTALASLAVNGTSTFNEPTSQVVNTVGSQTYSNTVILATDITMTSTGNSGVLGAQQIIFGLGAAGIYSDVANTRSLTVITNNSANGASGVGIQGTVSVGSFIMGGTGGGDISPVSQDSFVGGAGTVTAWNNTAIQPSATGKYCVNGFCISGARVLNIDASNDTKIYGQIITPNPVTDVSKITVTGLAPGDSILTIDLASAGYAQTATVAGSTYPITASNASGAGLANHYTAITYNNTPGQLNVTQAPLTVTANSTSKTYGQTVSFIGNEFFVTGTLYNGDNVTSVTLTSPGVASTAGVVGSPYAITPSNAVGSGLSNYAITYDPSGTITVNPATLVITPSTQTKTVGTPLPSTTPLFIVTGLQNGETIGVIDIVSAGLPSSAPEGIYPITSASNPTGGTFDPNNYLFMYSLTNNIVVNPGQQLIPQDIPPKQIFEKPPVMNCGAAGCDNLEIVQAKGNCQYSEIDFDQNNMNKSYQFKKLLLKQDPYCECKTENKWTHYCKTNKNLIDLPISQPANHSVGLAKKSVDVKPKIVRSHNGKSEITLAHFSLTKHDLYMR